MNKAVRYLKMTVKDIFYTQTISNARSVSVISMTLQ